MRRYESPAFILLGIYLVIEGLSRLVGAASALNAILGLLALAAGVLLLLRFLPVRRR
jgi:hypothetical protein